MKNLNEILIEEIYKLFSESEKGIYIGSRDQLRLAIQLKLNMFIPIEYLDKVFRAFISSGLILKLDKGKPIERQIGKRYYKLQTQRAYCLNKDIVDRDKKFESIKIITSDLNDKYSDLELDLVLERDRKIKRIGK